VNIPAPNVAVNNTFLVYVGGNTLDLLLLQVSRSTPVSTGARNHATSAPGASRGSRSLKVTMEWYTIRLVLSTHKPDPKPARICGGAHGGQANGLPDGRLQTFAAQFLYNPNRKLGEVRRLRFNLLLHASADQMPTIATSILDVGC
jgi:hypothetical protein